MYKFLEIISAQYCDWPVVNYDPEAWMGIITHSSDDMEGLLMFGTSLTLRCNTGSYLQLEDSQAFNMTIQCLADQRYPSPKQF